MSKELRYVLWGSAGHAKVLASIIYEQKKRIVAIFDNNPLVVSVLPGVPLYKGLDGFYDWLLGEDDPRTVIGFVAIGGSSGKDRLALHKVFKQNELKEGILVHSQAFVCESSQIGFGTQILANAVVAAESQLGEACIVNHCASIDHECIIGNGVHIAPGATLCGCVKIGHFAMVGAGAVVLPRLTIGANTIVGAGSVVTNNLPENVVAFGSPARIIRNRRIY